MLHPPPPDDAAALQRRVLFHAKSAYGDVYVVREGPLRILRFGAADAEDQTAYDPRRPRYEPPRYCPPHRPAADWRRLIGYLPR